MLHYAWYYLTFSGEFIKLLPYDSHNVAPFGATWTLGIEEEFYLIWPVLFFILVHRQRRKFVIPFLMLLIYPLPSFWMFRSYFGLLMGCTLALVLKEGGFVRLDNPDANPIHSSHHPNGDWILCCGAELAVRLPA